MAGSRGKRRDNRKFSWIHMSNRCSYVYLGFFFFFFPLVCFFDARVKWIPPCTYGAGPLPVTILSISGLAQVRYLSTYL